MPSLSHTAVRTVGAAIDACERALRRARVHFGHGTDNARDEAGEIVFFCAGIAHELGASAYSRVLGARQWSRIMELLERRIATRKPLPYLTRRAFFAGMELYVDERVLVPRSPIAELALQRFAPWIGARRVRRILDLGTGSGAIALACARAFPRAVVDAVDISADALAVCRRNVRRLGLAGRVRPVRSDLFAAVPACRYDIIVSNPPYVGRADLRRMPAEFRHEPMLGLAAGRDGLDAVRVILARAGGYLAKGGLLVVEVGNSERALVRAFPRLPFTWPDIAIGGGGVFLLQAQYLEK